MVLDGRGYYCVFYPGKAGELIIQENLGIDEVAGIFKEAVAANYDTEVIVFNMRGISQLSDAADHPENSYVLIAMEQGGLQFYEELPSEAEEIIAHAERYYLVDDIFIISDAALHLLIQEDSRRSGRS